VNTDKNLFEYKTYKAYLLALGGAKNSRRGEKSRFAQMAGCQPTYMSQVLHGKAHLSAEQAERLSRHLHHSPEEKNFFLLMLSKDRAGTTELKNFYQQQMDLILEKRLNVKDRLALEKNKLSEEERAIYYSSWQYAAIHIALTVPELQTREALVQHFQISHERLDVVLDFLVKVGLAETTKTGFVTGLNHIFIDRNSPFIFNHHANWRAQAVESLEKEKIQDLHYSGVFSLSRDDIQKLKDRTLEHIKANLDTVLASKEEEICVYTIDFFNLKKAV
jgi:uncharacterized protein (TIGR02147 family)